MSTRPLGAVRKPGGGSNTSPRKPGVEVWCTPSHAVNVDFRRPISILNRPPRQAEPKDTQQIVAHLTEENDSLYRELEALHLEVGQLRKSGVVPLESADSLKGSLGREELRLERAVKRLREEESTLSFSLEEMKQQEESLALRLEELTTKLGDYWLHSPSPSEPYIPELGDQKPEVAGSKRSDGASGCR